ncbi:MAG: TonB-dependent receptor [Candidatus Zixiibacteriota bacterium]
MKIRLIVILYLFIIAVSSTAKDNQELQFIDGIVVTASRSPQAFSDVTRQVTIINAEEIEKMPSTGIADILANAVGIDIRNRGIYGIQADISMRGGTFEQTVVLINGVKLTDPQTGHHLLDIPINKNNIESIEILNGAGSRLYGPNAIGGVINFITKKNQSKEIQTEFSIGDFGLTEFSAGLDYPHVGNLTVTRQHSDGFAYNTDFNILKATYSNNFRLLSGWLNIYTGYSDKEFGANKFYTGLYPEWEKTVSIFLLTSADFRNKLFSFEPKIFYRHHNDDFILSRYNPEIYRNKTGTNQYGLEMQFSHSTSWATHTIGVELAVDNINSTGLGDHFRNRGGLFIESQMKANERLTMVPGLMAYKYAEYNWQYFPGIDIGFDIINQLKITTSISKAFRIPTYTDLYNTSPSNLGNPALKPERAINYEAGFKLNLNKLKFNGTFFIRDGNDLIDWIQSANDTSAPWQAENVNEINTIGLEFTSELLIPKSFLRNIRFQYSYLDSKHEINNNFSDYSSKYALSHLRHLFQSSINIYLGKNVNYDIKFKYAKRLTDDEYNSVDGRLNWRINYFRVFTEVINIFSYRYSETGLSPMPGRWFRIGFALETPF